ncbi:MAG: methyltransferase domain-containing protein [Clostridiales bacterium]|nr:methyltransferase domain-containing protein [Clostridiales bacterium]
MEEFFVSRLDIYEHHMLREAAGVAEGYKVLAGYVPADTQTLLDLGCGTGLELEEIFKRCPNARVTGIDLAKAMLDKLREKYAGKQVELICASYLGYDFGTHTYDAAVSCETMHHLSYGEKLALYSNIHKALKPGGRYIECDYMAESQEEEARLSAQSRRIRAEHGIPKGELYHFDTPLTAQNQIKLLTQAGFALAEKLWRTGSTTIIVAQKP